MPSNAWLSITGAFEPPVAPPSWQSYLERREDWRQRGAYVYEWNTTMLASGTYYCTLYVNDEPLVKKAVKLNTR